MIVAVDEAYFEYVTHADYPDSLDYLREGKNILALRTFSKIYGLAGLRIGYGITTPEIAELMNKVRQPFNTNSLAQIGALAALADRKHVEKSIAVNNEGKQFLYQSFQQLGISYIPTETNFIMFETAQDAKDVFGSAHEAGRDHPAHGREAAAGHHRPARGEQAVRGGAGEDSKSVITALEDTESREKVEYVSSLRCLRRYLCANDFRFRKGLP